MRTRIRSWGIVVLAGLLLATGASAHGGADSDEDSDSSGVGVCLEARRADVRVCRSEVPRGPERAACLADARDAWRDCRGNEALAECRRERREGRVACRGLRGEERRVCQQAVRERFQQCVEGPPAGCESACEDAHADAVAECDVTHAVADCEGDLSCENIVSANNALCKADADAARLECRDACLPCEDACGAVRDRALTACDVAWNVDDCEGDNTCIAYVTEQRAACHDAAGLAHGECLEACSPCRLGCNEALASAQASCELVYNVADCEGDLVCEAAVSQLLADCRAEADSAYAACVESCDPCRGSCNETHAAARAQCDVMNNVADCEGDLFCEGIVSGNNAACKASADNERLVCLDACDPCRVACGETLTGAYAQCDVNYDAAGCGSNQSCIDFVTQQNADCKADADAAHASCLDACDPCQLACGDARGQVAATCDGWYDVGSCGPEPACLAVARQENRACKEEAAGPGLDACLGPCASTCGPTCGDDHATSLAACDAAFDVADCFGDSVCEVITAASNASCKADADTVLLGCLGACEPCTAACGGALGVSYAACDAVLAGACGPSPACVETTTASNLVCREVAEPVLASCLDVCQASDPCTTGCDVARDAHHALCDWTYDLADCFGDPICEQIINSQNAQCRADAEAVRLECLATCDPSAVTCGEARTGAYAQCDVLFDVANCFDDPGFQFDVANSNALCRADADAAHGVCLGASGG